MTTAKTHPVKPIPWSIAIPAIAWVTTMMSVMMWTLATPPVIVTIGILAALVTTASIFVRGHILSGNTAYAHIFYSTRQSICYALIFALILHASLSLTGRIWPENWPDLMLWATALAFLECGAWQLWAWSIRTQPEQQPNTQIVPSTSTNTYRIVDDSDENSKWIPVIERIHDMISMPHYQPVGAPRDVRGYDGKIYGFAWTAQGVLKSEWPNIQRQRGLELAHQQGRYDVTIDQIQVDKPGELPELTSAYAHKIAYTVGRLTGREIMKDWVQVKQLRSPMRVDVTAITEDVLAKALPYVDHDLGAKQLVAGFDIQGQIIPVSAVDHCAIFGMTGSGKSGTINNLMAQHTKRGQVWVCGIQKIYPLVGAWVDAMKDGGQLPILAVTGIDDTLEMITAAIRAAKARQVFLPHEIANLPRIVVIIDEISSLFAHSATATIDGQKFTTTQLIEEATRTTHSSGVYWVLASQLYNKGQWGDTLGNVGVRYIVRSNNGNQRQQIFDDQFYGLENLTHPGELYVSPMPGLEPMRGKGPYIQEPGKPVLHDGPTVTDIARMRSKDYIELDDKTAQAIGPFYLDRQKTWSQDYHFYLRGMRKHPNKPANELENKPANDDDKSLLENIDDVIAKLAIEQPKVVINTTPEPDRKTQILDLIRSNGGEITRGEIVSKAAQLSNPMKEGFVDNLLGQMASSGAIVRGKMGKNAVYSLPH